MSARVSATEALLAQAAAVTPAEAHTARLALIGCGGEVVKPLDRSLLVVGDGAAGQRLLAGDPLAARLGHPGPSVARRSYQLVQRMEQEQAAQLRTGEVRA